MRTVEVSIPGGQVVRLRMESDPEGRPLRLTISRGFSDALEAPVSRPPAAVVVPGDRVGELVDALQGLEASP